MTDFETRLRRTLHDELDPVVADPARGARVVPRARRARAARGAAALVLAASLLAAAVTTAGAFGDDGREPSPAAPPPTFGVFAIDSDGAPWRVAVDAGQGQVCYSAHVLGAGRVHLYRAGGGSAERVVSFLDEPAGYPSHVCAAVDRDAAERVIAAPESHYLEFRSGGESLSGRLHDRAAGGLPDVAKIVCGPRGAVALTPEVRPRRDGIHLQIYNYGGERGEFYLVAAGGGNEIGDLPADDVRENVSTFGPGELQVGCTDYAGNFSYDGTGSDRHAELTIVDPEGLWTDPELECGDGRRRRKVATTEPATEAPRTQPPAERLIRELVPGVEPDDVVERPLYPESEFKLEMRTLVRDGRRIARLYLTRDDGTWSVIPYVCPGYGVADREER